MPPKRAQASAPVPAIEEKSEEASPPTVPSPIKRRLLALAEERTKQQKRSPVKVRGVTLVKFLVEDEVIAFSVEGTVPRLITLTLACKF